MKYLVCMLIDDSVVGPFEILTAEEVLADLSSDPSPEEEKGVSYKIYTAENAIGIFGELLPDGEAEKMAST